jgi:hypothetical protein
MNRAERFSSKFDGVDQHRICCQADSRGESGSLQEKVRLMLMTSQQEARVRTMYVPFHGSKQMGSQTFKPEASELFDAKHSCFVNRYAASKLLDESWLLERCDGDPVLVNEVLQTFCAQGLIHIDAMHQSTIEGDIVATLFHVVRPDISDAKKHSHDTREHALSAISSLLNFARCCFDRLTLLFSRISS